MHKHIGVCRKLRIVTVRKYFVIVLLTPIIRASIGTGRHAIFREIQSNAMRINALFFRCILITRFLLIAHNNTEINNIINRYHKNTAK